LGELLDALDRTATAADGRRVRDVITTHQALQPFDPRNFEAGVLTPARPFSFDPLSYAGALAASGPRTEPGPVVRRALPAPDSGDVDLVDLRRLLTHPARGFLRQRLQVALTRGEEEPADALPVELDGLEKWAVGERVLHERLAGLSPAECIALERQRGGLPPGPLSEGLLREIGHQVDGLLLATTLEREYEPEAHDVDIALADGTRLAGTVTGVRGDTVLSLTYSKLSARHRLLAWIDLVALTVGRPDREWRAAAVGRGRGKGAVRSVFDPLPMAEATAALEELVALYRAGLCSPLPVPIKTAAAYAERRNNTDTPTAREGAAREWLSGMFPGEQDDPEHVLLYGEKAPLSRLIEERPEPGEGGPGWHRDETDRFGLLARRLWSRLLDAEVTVQT
ncbi:MAG TPA: exodeoxyribonuclease V subunit gamma, partial [Actinomycetes bacterium]